MFNEGDRVVCVAENDFGIKWGTYGTVLESNDDCPYVNWDNGETWALYDYRMELAERLLKEK